jgi:hypothetical protein
MKKTAFCLALISLNVAAQAQIDLSSYDELVVGVTMPTGEDLEEHRLYLSGVLIGLLRGTQDFARVQEPRPDAREGVFLSVSVTAIRDVNSVARALGGALVGKDMLAGDIRLTDLSTQEILGETQFDGRGTRGFIWNVGGGNIHAAIENFANSLLEWAGYSTSEFGKPLGWEGRIETGATIAVQCDGIDRKRAFLLTRQKQDSDALCELVTEELGPRGVSVDDSSTTVLKISMDAFGSPGTRLQVEPVLVMRWRIEGPDGLQLDDVLVTTAPAAAGRKGVKEGAAEVLRAQAAWGVDALLPTEN